MKSTRFCLMVAAVATVCSIQAAFAADDIHVQPLTGYTGPEYLPGQIIVQFKPGVAASVITQINEKNQARITYVSRTARFRVLSFPESIPPQAMVNIYLNNPNVEYAELNHVRYAFAVPNDPYYHYQWHFDNASYGGIAMAKAWDLSTGSGVVVAVVDTGIRPGTDLANTAFTAGWDFIDNDDDPTDDNGHGTHVAGTIAQSTNNGLGVAGVAYGCTLMPVRVLDASGVGTDATAADGIRWAADHGAQVINLSLGADASSETLEQAVTYASDKGVILVCASGNLMGEVSYPAAYPACIAVGATTYNESVAYYSNGGSALDLTAPGGNDWTDLNGDGFIDGVLQQTFDKNTGAWAYYFYVGTSMAAPHVSGVAALLIAQGIYTTPAEVKSRLESTAEDKGTPGWDSRYGWGIVNAYAALAGGPEPPPTLSSIAVTPATASLEVGDTQQYTATGTYSNGSTQDITATVTWDSSNTAVAPIDSVGLATSIGAGTTSITATLDSVTSGPATLTVTGAPSPTLSSIAATPATASLEVDGTQQYTATGTYSDGSTQDLTASVTWDSSDIAVATIDAAGLATGVSAGTTSITATLDSVTSGPATLTVTSPSTPGEIQVASLDGSFQPRVAGKNIFVRAVMNVTIRDGAGDPVEGATVTGDWSDAVRGTTTAVTDADGHAVLTSPEAKMRKNDLHFVLTITNVQKTGYTYDDGGDPPSATITWPK
jgi:serine protease